MTAPSAQTGAVPDFFIAYKNLFMQRFDPRLHHPLGSRTATMLLNRVLTDAQKARIPFPQTDARMTVNEPFLKQSLLMIARAQSNSLLAEQIALACVNLLNPESRGAKKFVAALVDSLTMPTEPSLLDAKAQARLQDSYFLDIHTLAVNAPEGSLIQNAARGYVSALTVE